MWDINRDDTRTIPAKCPQCGDLMANMGLDFEAPKKNDTMEWGHIKSLYSVGITFHSCGCSGPGYIPNTTEKLKAYFQGLLLHYHKQLDFWRQRLEPSNSREEDRDKSKNWQYISAVPKDIRPKKGSIKNDDAKQYWFDRIKDIESKLNTMSTSEFVKKKSPPDSNTRIVGCY